MKALLGKYPEDGDSARHVEIVIDDYDTWSVKTTIATLVVPLLEAHKAANKHGIMGAAFEQARKEFGLTKADSREHWDRLCTRGIEIQNGWMDEMIYSFTQVREYNVDAENDQRVKLGLALFAKHFQNLWT